MLSPAANVLDLGSLRGACGILVGFGQLAALSPFGVYADSDVLRVFGKLLVSRHPCFREKSALGATLVEKRSLMPCAEMNALL